MADLGNDILTSLGDPVGEWLSINAAGPVATVLLAAFGIAVGFIAYKLIKRALNKV